MDSIKVSRRFEERKDSQPPSKRSRNDDKDKKDEERSRDRDKKRDRSPKQDRSRERKRRRSRSRSRETDRKQPKRNGNSSSRDRQPKEELKDEKPEVKNHELIAEELRQKEVMYQAKMQLQEKIRSKNSNIKYEKAAILRPDEAAVFLASSHMSKQKINDMKRNVEQMKESLKKAAVERQTTEDSSNKGTSSSTLSGGVDFSSTVKNDEEETKPSFEYIPGTAPGTRRKRTTFNFVEKGTFEKQAQKERTQAKLSKLQNTISTAAKQTGISSAVRLAIVTPASAEVVDDLPAIEWWDHVLLSDAQDYDGISDSSLPVHERYASTITNLIEHPVKLKPPNAALDKVCIKAHLTKKEMKRLRRMNRRETQREEQEKIRLGLAPVPEPKVKMANLMRVLGNEAIQDPTKMESFARQQEAQRLKKHLDTNAERKLTKEERSEKKTRKIMEDTSIMVHVAVYKVLSLTNPSKRFKVLVNAKQLQMTGIVVSVEDMHVIVVEGGPKQQRTYKKLMLNRINWSEELVGQKKGVAKEDEDGQRNECVLVWKGTVPKREFNAEPKIQLVPDHRSARDIFARHNVAHYWDHCFSHSILLGPSTSGD